MNPYFHLLFEAGILTSPPPSPPPSPVEYLGEDVELWEFYDRAGKDDIRHAAEMGIIKEFGLDYDDEQGRDWVKIHRYSRRARFRSTLYQLLDMRGIIPLAELQIIRRGLRLYKISRAKIWNQVRGLLKGARLQRHYNRIPAFIKFSTGLYPKITGEMIDLIFRDFDRMHTQFNNELAGRWKRAYFPNLRFVALKLIQKHGKGVFPYNVPLLRTMRKQKYLNILFEEFELY
jgi:hypothetical protein